MPKYVIERNIQGIGSVGEQEFINLSQRSCRILQEMGPEIEWVHSYVTGDKVFCVYIAESAEQLLEHAARGGFPADAIHEIYGMLAPSKAGLY